ncbi:MAG: hypothetical protein E7050_07320 [Lentisphaerae bacterium]|nr:hypothetical protein [Lentisphaerota bacterium]
MNLLKSLLFLALASLPLFAADGIHLTVMDFESDGQYHTDAVAHTGKKSYKFAGIGKYTYRKFPLNLIPDLEYNFSIAIRKGVCDKKVASKMDFILGGYVPGNKKFNIYVMAGGTIAGDDQWHVVNRKFKVPAGHGNFALMLYNRTDVDYYIDSLKIEPVGAVNPQIVQAGNAPVVPAEKKASGTAVTRPVPPVSDEQAEKEEKDWMNNRRGIEALDDDFILPPFTPVTLKGMTASVWGREYTFGADNLLDKVSILGENFLAGPMEFTAVVNGKEVKFKTGKPVVIRERKGIVEFLSRANSENMDIEVRTAVEYDGMIKVDFTFDPRGSVQLDSFKYTIPYQEKYAKFIHYTGPRQGGFSLNIPKTSNTRRLPEGSGTLWKSPFKIMVWLGSYDRGLLWFCKSEENWSPHDREKREDGLSVVRDGGVVKLEVVPVSRPKLVSKRTTYTFGLMATPVRPRTPGWRNTDMDYEYNAATASRKYGANFPVIYSSGSYNYLDNGDKNPAAVGFYPRLYNVDNYRKKIEKAHRENRLYGIYIDPILCNLGVYKDMSLYKEKIWDPTTDNADAAGTKINAPFLWQPPEVKKFFAEWRKEPLSTAPYGSQKGEKQFQPGLGSRYADFFCYLLEKHAENGADGIANLDEWGPVPDANARHGMGYYELDGKRYPEYDWFARRDMLKRMCAVFYKKHGKLPIMRVHLAATLVAPIASFCDSVVTGESVNSAYFSRADVMDEYTVNREEMLESLKKGGRDFLYYVSTPDRWAIEYGGQAFGWNVCLTCNLTKSPKIDKAYAFSDEGTRDYLAMCLVHDNTLFPVFCKPDSAYKVVRIKQDFKIGDPEVKFHAYWHDSQPVTVDGKECYTGVWENKGKYLAVVANLSLEDQNLTVEVPAGYKVIDAESKEPIAVSGGKFKTMVTRRNYKLYLLNK